MKESQMFECFLTCEARYVNLHVSSFGLLLYFLPWVRLQLLLHLVTVEFGGNLDTGCFNLAPVQ